MVHIRKNFYLASNYDINKGQPAIDDLNKILGCVGVSFDVSEVKNGKRLFITVDERKLKSAINSKGGRPVEKELDFEAVEKMKDDGKTNKQIYTELGMSKSLFYLKMKEYKNNIGQGKRGVK